MLTKVSETLIFCFSFIKRKQKVQIKERQCHFILVQKVHSTSIIIDFLRQFCIVFEVVIVESKDFRWRLVNNRFRIINHSKTFFIWRPSLNETILRWFLTKHCHRMVPFNGDFNLKINFEWFYFTMVFT